MFAAETSLPLERAHAHNDYEHRRPLLDALDHGFCSIEADIYLVDGQLLVAHDRPDVSSQRTLQALYLDPLRERVRKNAGRVYRVGPSITLLIDIKSEADATYRALRDVLQNYSEMLTVFGPTVRTNAITVIISGNRPRQLMQAESERLAAYDGRLEDLEGSESSAFIPLVSENWARVFRWRGEGPMPAAEKEKLRQIVQRAHSQGRRIRFWATPDRPSVWTELCDAGVDLINTDDLPGLSGFLAARAKAR